MQTGSANCTTIQGAVDLTRFAYRDRYTVRSPKPLRLLPMTGTISGPMSHNVDFCMQNIRVFADNQIFEGLHRADRDRARVLRREGALQYHALDRRCRCVRQPAIALLSALSPALDSHTIRR